MSNTMRTAAAGLLAQQQRIDTIANNIANINTTGYKSQRIDFGDALYTAMQNPAQPADSQTGNLQLGHGLTSQSVIRDDRSGPLDVTGQPLDLALDGPGFFQVESADGSVAYTRDGSFGQVALDGQFFLVTSSGQFVLDADRQRISASQSLDFMAITPDGQLVQDKTPIARLGIVQFADPSSLESLGGNVYRASAASGDPVATTTTVRQGALEGSNVSLADEMTRLMQAQRAYSLMSRALTTADQMRATENDIRR
ncbi:MAG: flagellar hook-basal body protein [Eubacteriales bacterium]|nr:flagellar hook-basal body protein [Eubacteriales bacterium]